MQNDRNILGSKKTERKLKKKSFLLLVLQTTADQTGMTLREGPTFLSQLGMDKSQVLPWALLGWSTKRVNVYLSLCETLWIFSVYKAELECHESVNTGTLWYFLLCCKGISS